MIIIEIYIFFYSSLKPYVVTPHLNRLIKTVQMRCHNICFYAELSKLIPNYQQILSLIYSSDYPNKDALTLKFTKHHHPSLTTTNCGHTSGDQEQWKISVYQMCITLCLIRVPLHCLPVYLPSFGTLHQDVWLKFWDD